MHEKLNSAVSTRSLQPMWCTCNKTPDVTLTLNVNQPQKEQESHPFGFDCFHWKTWFPTWFAKETSTKRANIRESKLCRQLLCCTPIKKTRCSTRHHGSALFQAPDWQISTSRGSAPEIDRGRGVSLRFRCYICFIRWHFVCIVFFCLFCFVVLCLFLFGISSMDHFIACCKTSLTTTTRFILLYLPWWSVNPIFGKNNLEKAHRSCPWPHCSSHKKKRPYFPWNSGCLWGSLRMVYEIIPYIWIPFGFM